jgi:hypothetical protein
VGVTEGEGREKLREFRGKAGAAGERGNGEQGVCK